MKKIISTKGMPFSYEGPIYRQRNANWDFIQDTLALYQERYGDLDFQQIDRVKKPTLKDTYLSPRRNFLRRKSSLGDFQSKNDRGLSTITEDAIDDHILLKKAQRSFRQDSFSSNSRSSCQSPVDNILEYEGDLWGNFEENFALQEKIDRAKKYHKGLR